MILPATSKEFLSRYWLKEDLLKICKEYNLPKTGSKQDLLNYITCYIDNKPVIKKENQRIKKCIFKELSVDMIIENDYSNDENHRHFFSAQIGDNFKFNVRFMNWIKENKGKKTYQQAIEEWKRIFEEKKNGYKSVIGHQFEYNRYTRDFFEKNKGRTNEECIKCWNYKKTKPGLHIYEDADLTILK